MRTTGLRTRAAVAGLLAAALLTGGVENARADSATFTDGADDAYRAPGPLEPLAMQPPNQLLSDPTADIVSAGFATATARGNKHAYNVFLTISGTPSADYSYVVAGDFGGDCQLYHLLTPGTTGNARAFCGSGPSRRLVMAVLGTVVTVSDSTLSATIAIDPKLLPPELQADRTLNPLYAYTCVSGLEGRGCRPEEKLDKAQDPFGSFTV